MSCNKVVDLNLKGHRVFINSPLEKFNLSLLPEGGRGSVNNFLCLYSSCPIYAREGGGEMRMDQCLLLSNFFFFEGFPKQHHWTGINLSKIIYIQISQIKYFHQGKELASLSLTNNKYKLLLLMMKTF